MKTILSIFALLQAFIPGIAGTVCTPDNVRVVDVVVIGAGAAGLRATSRLQEEDPELDVLVLEGADYIGGRVHSFQFGDYTMEQCAAWTYDFPQNEMFQLAREYGLDMTLQDYFDIDAYDKSGDPIDDKVVKRTLRVFQNAWRCVQRKMQRIVNPNRPTFLDTGALGLLDECGWTDAINDADRGLDYFAQWLFLSYEYAQGDVTLSSFPENVYADPNYLIVDQNGGYQGLLEWYASSAKTDIRNRIALETTVQRVSYSEQPVASNGDDYTGSDYYASVIAEEKDGPCTEYIAKRVISTVSVGVLKNQHIEFDDALDTGLLPLEMQQYVKIFFQFDDYFWGNAENLVTLRDATGPERGICHQWQNYEAEIKTGPKKGTSTRFLPEGNHILVCTLLSEEYAQVATDEKGNILELDTLLDPLRAAFPDAAMAGSLDKGNYRVQPIILKDNDLYGNGAVSHF